MVKLRWVFPAAILRRNSRTSSTVFSLRHFPTVDAAADRRFFRA